MGTEYILQMKNIKKSFSGVEVLHGVDLDVRAGEVRALVGENGTGKSTLMKILGGIYDSDSGEIYINGKKTSISSAQDAQDLGVSIIHQERLSMRLHMMKSFKIWWDIKLKTIILHMSLRLEKKCSV